MVNVVGIASQVEPTLDRHIIAVRGETDPQMLLRIAGLFAQRNILPDLIISKQLGELLTVEIQVSGCDLHTTELIISKIRNIVSVDRAFMVGDFGQ